MLTTTAVRLRDPEASLAGRSKTTFAKMNRETKVREKRQASILRKEQRRDPGAVEAFFSSHPPPQDRIAGLEAEIAKRRVGRRDTREFRAIKARLLKMKPAAAMPAR